MQHEHTTSACTYNWVKTTESSANGETGKATLCDGGVNNTLVAEAIEETLGDLVGTVVLGNLLTEDESLGVLLELLGQSLVEGLTDGVLLDAVAVSIGSGVVCAKVDGAVDGAGVLCEGGGGRALDDGGSGGRRGQTGSRSEEAGHVCCDALLCC